MAQAPVTIRRALPWYFCSKPPSGEHTASGNAMIALVPDWDDLPSLQHGLAEFPGAQILIVIPARIPGEPT